MRRRVLLIGTVTTMVPGALAAQTQKRDGMRRLGVLMGGGATDPLWQGLAAIFVRSVGDLGWREGENLEIEWRWGSGDGALIAHQAAELVALKPDAIFCQTSPATLALKRETNTVPIVFVRVTDPIGLGVITSLARPGGNVTGFTDYDVPLAGKWLEMLTQITPRVARVAVLHNPATAPYAGLMLRAMQEAAPSFGMTVQAAPVDDEAGIETTMTRVAREDRGGLLALPHVFTSVHRDAIIAAAARHRLPAVYGDRTYTAAGGLMAYGVDGADLFRRAASYVDRVLKGTKPGDLPVQNPTEFELTVNLGTTRALGVTVAPALLGAADEVIE